MEINLQTDSFAGRACQSRSVNVTRVLRVGSVLAIVALLAGCRTEYRGMDADIDGHLWRQVAAVEDPLWGKIYDTSAVDPEEYVRSLGGAHWDGSSNAGELAVDEGAVVIHDVTLLNDWAEFSVFISSGPRPNVASDEGTEYTGPSQVYTCFRVHVTAAADPDPQLLDDEPCPKELLANMPGDAAFAEDSVFDG